MNKRGFTLIELLAVIVILAVVMLIGVTAVLPLINKAQKNALASEGLALISTGKVAYNAEQLSTSELNLAPNASYCFSLDWLRKHNYYDKASDKYAGSVLIYSNNSGKYDYYFWISNGNYHISGGTADSYEIEDGPGGEEIYTCGDLNLDNRCSYSSSLSYLSESDCNKLYNYTQRITDTLYNNNADFISYYGQRVEIEQHYCNSNRYTYLSNFGITDTIKIPFQIDDLLYISTFDLVDGYHDSRYKLSMSDIIGQSNKNNNYSVKPLAFGLDVSFVPELPGIPTVFFNPTNSSKTVTLSFTSNMDGNNLNNLYILRMSYDQLLKQYMDSSSSYTIYYSRINLTGNNTYTFDVDSGMDFVLIASSDVAEELLDGRLSGTKNSSSDPNKASNDLEKSYKASMLGKARAINSDNFFKFRFDNCGSGNKIYWQSRTVTPSYDYLWD